MPEQLTKHPEVTLQVLKSAGAQCGQGAPQTILTRCPAERFCKLPGGEVCVYGLADAPRMTQITAVDWQGVQRAVSLPEPAAASASVGVWVALAGSVLALIAGVALGMRLARRR
jgi:uncharacterized protein YneF (UPF0154 family)